MEAEASDGEAAEAAEAEEEMDDEAWAKAVQSGNLSKGERLVPVDHSTIAYPSFRKVPPPSLWAVVNRAACEVAHASGTTCRVHHSVIRVLGGLLVHMPMFWTL